MEYDLPNLDTLNYTIDNRLVRIQVFINSCLRKTLRIFWPDTITNNLLLERTYQIPVEEEISKKCWKCTGHTLPKSPNCVTRMSGRPKNTLCGEMETDRYEKNDQEFDGSKNDGEDLEDVKTFIYVDNVTVEHGGPDADVKAWIGKARAAYLQLKNIWKSKQHSVNQHQGQNFQYKYQDSSTVCGGNMENYESHHPEYTGIY
ncbi:unnamed protein product [Schistosoma curassoni]|uniref:NTR domain-containing protein n=1 Tax=Schistosoma curassoni TaxID=6186 RepID=A0A183JZT7_9TREM|nr:unnamed protein product [Schistosoma curassoni]